MLILDDLPLYSGCTGGNFAYDPLTNRITQYQLGMGSNYVKGDLTWNSNGTLARQTITDTVNSTNTQTCNYNYDDLGRLGKADCGTAWGQTFNYDAFGNITKNVISGSTGVSFQPTYASSTNRMSALPGATPTYNAFGALTSDGTRAYSWDAVGNMLSADSTVVIYDALDRAAEIQKAGIYTQVVYSPIGKVALFNSGNLATAFAGGQAIYTAAGLQRIRHTDYLGSSRLTTTTTLPTQKYTDVSYAPFGEPYNESGAQDRSFTGQNQDTAQGLYDFLYRSLDPVQGRWISPDPLGLGAVTSSNPQSWNRYAYVNNTPMAAIDQLGLASTTILVGGCQVTVYYNKIHVGGDEYRFEVYDFVVGLCAGGGAGGQSGGAGGARTSSIGDGGTDPENNGTGTVIVSCSAVKGVTETVSHCGITVGGCGSGYTRYDAMPSGNPLLSTISVQKTPTGATSYAPGNAIYSNRKHPAGLSSA